MKSSSPAPTRSAIWRGQQIANQVRIAARHARQMNTCQEHQTRGRACFYCVYGSLAGHFVETIPQMMTRSTPPPCVR